MSNDTNEAAAGEQDAAEREGKPFVPSTLEYGDTFVKRAAAALKLPDPVARPDFLTGYRLIDDTPLGEGGMGVVWKATQISTKRLVALKIMSAAGFGSERAQARFEREVELTAKLDHPHIARIYDSGLQDGVCFYAMELIDGVSLDAYVTLHKLPGPRILELMKVVCRAIQYTHQNGIIHRDLKPGNILVDSEGQPHVLDFGLAKALENDPQLSIDGDISGTPAFMSPEQACGRLDMLDTRSDVYTLGVILFNLVTGQFPHNVRGPNFRVMKRIVEEEPQTLRKVDPRADRELEVLLSKALAKDPKRRYGTAGELADDLDRYLKREPLIARPPTLGYVFGRKLSKYRVAVTIGAVVFTLLTVMITVAGLTLRGMVTRQQKATHAAGMVKRLIDADTAYVPAIVDEMAGYRQWADHLLREENAKAAADSRQKLHTSLALLPVDDGQVDYLYGRLLTAEPNEVPVIRDALFPHKGALIERLWSVAQTPGKGREASRLRVAAALAKYDPAGARWATCSSHVVYDLVRENPVFLGQWSKAFRPVRNHLLAALMITYRDLQPQHLAERNVATSLLGDYAADQPQVLADLIMDADEKQFSVIYPKFKAQAVRGLPVLISELDQTLPPQAKDEVREKLAKRQANAAVALLKMNQPAKVWPLLRHSPDPRARSYLIHRLGPLGVDPKAVINRLEVESDLSIRRALVLSLGEFSEQDLTSDDRKLLTPKLQDLYRTAADPGLHSAVEWLLRTWKQEAWLREVNEQWAKGDATRVERFKAIAGVLAGGTPDRLPQWYVNGQGETMVVIPGPVEFMMGSPVTEANRVNDERQHKRRIGRTFAIASKPVTGSQYRRFAKGWVLPEVYARTPDLPVVGTSWYEAATYCNWLSEQEGIPQDQRCYENDSGRVKMKENYLSLTGYRLPTEAEMEYATRAGAITSRYYGESDDLLSNYAWNLLNSGQQIWPVANKKPNDLGLFDAHGNVWCWCQDSYAASYPFARPGDAIEDKEGALDIDDKQERVLRGGALNAAAYVRSAYRTSYMPTNRNSNFGFRPARTLPADGR